MYRLYRGRKVLSLISGLIKRIRHQRKQRFFGLGDHLNYLVDSDYQVLAKC